MTGGWSAKEFTEAGFKELEGRPVFANKGGKNKAANHFFVRDDEHPYIEKKPFAWVRGYVEKFIGVINRMNAVIEKKTHRRKKKIRHFLRLLTP